MSSIAAVGEALGPLATDNPELISAFRRVLDAHGFAGPAVPTAMGGPLRSEFHLRSDLPLYLRRLAGPAPINTLIKLFVLDQVVDAALVAAAVAPLDIVDVQSLGLIELTPAGVRARVRLSGYLDLILAHDVYDEHLGELKPDHVLDVNPTTITLSNLTVRRRAGRALDLGTGCGVLALVAARHAGHVVGTDTNPRALNMAAFNARLNGIENVEWRSGSLFEPVAGERFDLVVCNPPYVISPESRYEFRDGGRRGDALSEEVVRRMPAHLEDGGFASILCNWAIASGEDVFAAPRRWAEGGGCDSLLLFTAAQDPLTYAAIWNRSRDRDRYDAALERWTRHFRELNIESVGLGAVILRKRATTTPAAARLRTERLDRSPAGACGEQIERMFAADDFLESLDRGVDLMTVRFRTAEHRLEQTLALRDGAYRIERSEVALADGFRFRGEVDPVTAGLLARCDGTRALADVLGDLPLQTNAKPDEVAAACAIIVRRLVASGFLIPVLG